MSDARRLRPHELARLDQMLAEAATLARDEPSTLVIATTFAQPGQPCSWCDCPGPQDSPHDDPDYHCAGCPRVADTITYVWRSRERHGFPVCRQHSSDLMSWISALTSGRAVEFRVRPILDEDMDGTR